METIWENIQVFAVCFARSSSFLFVLPILGNRSVPLPAKIGASFFLSIFSIVALQNTMPQIPTDIFPFTFIIINEVAIGLTLGFSAKFLFAGIQMAGELVGMQMGLAIAKIMDPGFQQQGSIVAEFQSMIAMLIYLIMDGHHFLLQGFAYSYKQLPLLSSWPVELLTRNIVHIAGTMFVFAVKIGAPIVVTLLLANIALGLLARTVPQMNIFMVGLPLRLGMGIMGLAFTITLFGHIFGRLLRQFQHDYLALLKFF